MTCRYIRWLLRAYGGKMGEKNSKKRLFRSTFLMFAARKKCMWSRICLGIVFSEVLWYAYMQRVNRWTNKIAARFNMYTETQWFQSLYFDNNIHEVIFIRLNFDAGGWCKIDGYWRIYCPRLEYKLSSNISFILKSTLKYCFLILITKFNK